ncbi:SMR family transporter [Nocardioides sp. CER19]|uniref:DMT family transporter n=1 Tax=Nocardioides sp. CER19 TaxID=3038538 RepID=UPI002446A400|nr:SMR family transporter [Nocardioides sp. CER19]MDH2416145.1 SMR family transporter [Nocardioides sp. CER19]
MHKWVFLVGAILGEVTGSLSMEAATRHPIFYTIVAVGYGISFALYSGALRRGMALSVASSVWAGSGVLLTAIFSALVYKERFAPTAMIGLALVCVGVVLVSTGARPKGKVGRPLDGPSEGPRHSSQVVA